MSDASCFAWNVQTAVSSMAILRNHYRTHDLGLLVVRVSIGIMFTIHGYPKLIGCPEKWTELAAQCN